MEPEVTITGEVTDIATRTTSAGPVYDLLVNGIKYSTFEDPGSPNRRVTFTAYSKESKGRHYWNIKKGTLSIAKESSGNTPQPSGNTPQSGIDAREARAMRQDAQNTAAVLVAAYAARTTTPHDLTSLLVLTKAAAIDIYGWSANGYDKVPPADPAKNDDVPW